MTRILMAGEPMVPIDSDAAARTPKYWAFISHSHQDQRRWWFFFRRRWGDVLHRRLESYRIPRKLVGRRTSVGVIPRRIFPLFLDAGELPTAPDLFDALDGALRDSGALIVICSPNAESSRWVNREVVTFKSQSSDHRHRVFCLIVAGEPNADDKPHLHLPECFPDGLRYEVAADKTILRNHRVEPVAADVRPGSSSLHDATLKIVAGIIGIGYDELKQRDAVRWWWNLARNIAILIAVFGTAGWIADSALRRARQEVSSLHEWRIKEQNMPFPRMAGKYTDPEVAALRQRRDTAAELVRMNQARVEAEVAYPAETEGLAHDFWWTEAELAWSLGNLRDAEEKLERAVAHVERQAEIMQVRYEEGVDRLDALLLANSRRDQTRLALVRLKQVIQDLKAAGLLRDPSK